MLLLSTRGAVLLSAATLPHYAGSLREAFEGIAVLVDDCALRRGQNRVSYLVLVL